MANLQGDFGKNSYKNPVLFLAANQAKYIKQKIKNSFYFVALNQIFSKLCLIMFMAMLWGILSFKFTDNVL